MGEQTDRQTSKQTNKNLYTLQAYTSHSEAYEVTEDTGDQNNGENVAETAERMLGIGVEFIIMVPVLYSPKYIYSML